MTDTLQERWKNNAVEKREREGFKRVYVNVEVEIEVPIEDAPEPLPLYDGEIGWDAYYLEYTKVIEKNRLRMRAVLNAVTNGISTTLHGHSWPIIDCWEHECKSHDDQDKEPLRLE